MFIIQLNDSQALELVNGCSLSLSRLWGNMAQHRVGGGPSLMAHSLLSCLNSETQQTRMF